MKLLTQGTIICRTGWCDICAKENRPHTGQLFLTIGSTGIYHVKKAERIAPRYGFTPHLYQLVKSLGDNVVFNHVCGMECSVNIDWDSTNYKWLADVKESYWKRGIMELKDWNALVMYKRDEDYIV